MRGKSAIFPFQKMLSFKSRETKKDILKIQTVSEKIMKGWGPVGRNTLSVMKNNTDGKFNLLLQYASNYVLFEKSSGKEHIFANIVSWRLRTLNGADVVNTF